MSDVFTLTLDSPITEEQWDMITDVDFDYTNEITFHTKHGKEVKFVKPSAQPEPQWIPCSEKQVEASCLACDKFGQMFITTSIVVINHKCYDGTDFDFAKPDDFLKGVNIGHGVRLLPREIIAWMPLPEPYKEEQE